MGGGVGGYQGFSPGRIFHRKAGMRERGGHGDYHSTQKTSANHVCAPGGISWDTKMKDY